jgi:tryptophan synthase alpha chain
MKTLVCLNRIDSSFLRLRSRRRKAFVAYITAGDPSLDATEKMAHAFEAKGVDILELGVPFSDPLADGVVNQLAADRALKAGTSLHKILRSVSKMRRHGLKIPIVLFTYFNPIHRYGVADFVRDAARAGVDGILNLDLPSEEAAGFESLLKKRNLHSICLIAPTTEGKRLVEIAKKARGFIYYVSREGVTGMQTKVAQGVNSRMNQIRRLTRTPIVIGFGISTPVQVRQVASFADGCVVGSAIVDRIGKIGDDKSLVRNVSRFVGSMVAPLHS